MTPELAVGQSALLTDLAMCVNYYRLFTPGLYCCMFVPVQLDEDTRLCPGLTAMINSGRHQQCTADPPLGGFSGPPNFILDVFPRDSLQDYEYRRSCFERAGVVEYAAVQDLGKPLLMWNRRVDGKFTRIEEDDPGFIQSTALPGLRILLRALAERDWWSIMAAIAQGISRRPHHELMESIWRK